ncbi:hypothetical protein [Mucilaginibacter endophyticus]|uniref:hypothetical protein n=1 Tax=Mucilaginibacter endophyticus TaxID=2675003 RepID=UPI000E0DF9F1|nr:hypothetical protein [Mucilaginibacter endophyticus]
MPSYVIEELIIRLQACNKGVGTLKSYIRLDEQMIIKTTRGMITVSMTLLNCQLQEPAAITREEIAVLAGQFIRSGKRLDEEAVII